LRMWLRRLWRERGLRVWIQSRLQPADKSSPAISESSTNALESLLNNRYARKPTSSVTGQANRGSVPLQTHVRHCRSGLGYWPAGPMPEKLRRPASNPDHYDNVVREFAEAPNRDWLGRLRIQVHSWRTRRSLGWTCLLAGDGIGCSFGRRLRLGFNSKANLLTNRPDP
jgi:hypothetical protein